MTGVNIIALISILVAATGLFILLRNSRKKKSQMIERDTATDLFFRHMDDL
jgi:hypothetical protein